jgi:lipase
MRLHLHEWGDPGAPPLVWLHGVTGHGRRARRLAEERLTRFHVLAPDLRGHGFSDWEPPWTIATHAHDLLETLDAAGVGRAVWIGHSFGGRLLLEIGALDLDRIDRAVLLDPAISMLPHVALGAAELERADHSFASPAEAVDARGLGWPTPVHAVEEDVREHLVQSSDGRWRYRYCRSAAVSILGELASPPPAAETFRVPTLLVHAPAYGLVHDEHVDALRAALGDLLTVETVPGGHMVIWDAYDETAAAVSAFLEADVG